MNNFIEEDMSEEDFPMEEMRLNVANNLQSFRQVGNLFGDFLYRFSQFFINYLGGKTK